MYSNSIFLIPHPLPPSLSLPLYYLIFLPIAQTFVPAVSSVATSSPNAIHDCSISLWKE